MIFDEIMEIVCTIKIDFFSVLVNYYNNYLFISVNNYNITLYSKNKLKGRVSSILNPNNQSWPHENNFWKEYNV